MLSLLSKKPWSINKVMKWNLNKLVVFILIMLGVATVFMGGSVIFNLFGIRQLEGNYVPFIVQANFICGILYLLTAYEWIKNRRWVFWPMLIAVLILVFAFGALLIFINAGTAFENKTLVAMVFRTAVTVGILIFIKRSLNSKNLPV